MEYKYIPAVPFSVVTERENGRGVPPVGGVVTLTLISTPPRLSLVVYEVALNPTTISGPVLCNSAVFH